MTSSTARRDGLAAIAAAEAYHRGDDEGLAACAPATLDEALAQRNLLVMMLGDIIDAGGQQFLDAVRTALIEGPIPDQNGDPQ